MAGFSDRGIFIEKVSGIDYAKGDKVFAFTDHQGARFVLTIDALAHIVGVVTHCHKDQTVEQLLNSLCNCSNNKGKTK